MHAIIHTPRLVLRPPRADDAPLIFERWAQDPEVTRYLTWRPHTSVAETTAFVQNCIAAWRDGTGYPWVITAAADGPPIGMIDLRPAGHQASFGYLLARSAWGHGYMTEAAREVVARALAEPTVWRVWAVCDVDNLASARVLERVGLEYEGTLRRAMLHPNLSPEPRDAQLYASVR